MQEFGLRLNPFGMPVFNQFAIIGFTQYKDKILSDGLGLKIFHNSRYDYSNGLKKIIWGDETTNVSECFGVLREISGKSQMQLIFDASFFEKEKEVIIEYNPIEEEIALKQIFIMLLNNPMVGLEVADVYEMVSTKMKFLSCAIEKSDESGYIMSAKNWLNQMILNHHIKDNVLFFVSGEDTTLQLVNQIVNIYQEIAGNDKHILFQAEATDFVIPDGIRISSWISEADG